MKKVLCSLLVASTAFLSAQQMVALTGKTNTQIVFNDFRTLDKAGKSDRTIFSDTTEPRVFSQALNQNFTESKESAHHSQAANIAALAMDASGNLLYTPMYSSNLYVLNPKTKAITLVENSVMKPVACNLGSQFTRMTLSKDNAVYALDNDGSQLVKITEKSGKYSVENLGAVKMKNTAAELAMSIPNAGFGGDMIADSKNNLYVFAAYGNVYKLNIKDLSSTFVGKISQLPKDFSINGAAVAEDGTITVASAKGMGLFSVTPETWEASPISNGENLPVYDLASPYFLYDKERFLMRNWRRISIFTRQKWIRNL